MTGYFRSLTLAALMCTPLAACGESDRISSEKSEAVPVVWTHSDDPEKTFTLGPGADGGLSALDPSGIDVGQIGSGDITSIDVRDGIFVTDDNGNPDTAKPVVIVAATNSTKKTILVASLNAETGSLSAILDDPILSNFDSPQEVCLYRSAVNDNLYVFAADRDGSISQWLLYDSGKGTLRNTVMRTWSAGAPVISCEADDENGSVDIVVADGSAWRYGAEPKDNFNQRERIN